MAKTSSRKYDESHITGFKRDLEKIRAKPSLYIGPTDNAGVFTILRECMDNAVDEARAGRNTLISVEILKDGSFWITDSGVGIPVKKHKIMGISTLTHVLTNLQSSGKMATKDGAYTSAIGTHGVGIKATNALSEFFEIWTFREDSGGWHYTRFEQGKEVTPVTKQKPDRKLKAKSGTLIHFKPDAKIFAKSKLDIKAVATWMEMTSYMNAGLTLRLKAGEKMKEWKTTDGIRSYLKKKRDELKANPFSPKYVFHNSGTLEMALAFTDVEGAQVEFFTNTVRNIEEGVHADDIYKALFDSLKSYKGKEQFTPTDIKDGLLGIANYKIDAPQFDSQTKEKLVDVRVKGVCYKEALDVFSTFWKANPKLAKDLCLRASELRKKVADFLKDKKLVKNVNAAKKTLITKLAAVVGGTPIEKRELFIVEGDSAGGGAKRARDKSFQAIYPLRGKPLNVMDAQKDKINSNAEVVGLLAALGVDLGGTRPNLEAAYGKIILLADADVDGSHINVLILGVLYKFTPHLIKNGQVFTVRSPLYKGRHKNVVYFGMTQDEVWKKAGARCELTYLKGWGEVSPEDLGVALDPTLRTLVRINATDLKGHKKFEELLGKSPLFRKQLFGVE